jgi:hypothetical protein
VFAVHNHIDTEWAIESIIYAFSSQTMLICLIRISDLILEGKFFDI